MNKKMVRQGLVGFLVILVLISTVSAASLSDMDFNNDGRITLGDIFELIKDFGRTGNLNTDLNNDAQVNLFDIVLVAKNIGKQVPQGGLELHYMFNENQGGTAFDASGNGRDGTILGATWTEGPNPELGTALSFDGNDYVNTNSVLNLNEFTLMAWLKPTTRSSNTVIMEKSDSYWMNIRYDTGKVRTGGFFGGCADASWLYVDSSQILPLNQWIHVAATYDGSQLKTYFNGNLVSSIAANGLPCSNQNTLAIGAKHTPGSSTQNYLEGDVDDVRVYSQALSQSEIADIAGTVPSYPICSDGTCDPSEDCSTCPTDCGPCEPQCTDSDNDGYDRDCGIIDCNDNNAGIHPGANEICGNGIDEDCDGQADEGCPAACVPTTEVCDGVDNDCDGAIDEGFDNDGDSYTICNGDCDDNNPSIRPGAFDVCGNGVDENCDGYDSQCTSGLPVIPGGAGFGMDTRAAYGNPGVNPTVYKVTNLANSGGGSLRACLQASVPRICVFEVSGTITTTSDFEIRNPYITIAGQTAPSPGITIRGAAIRITTHDVLLQHLRIRVGDGPGPGPDNRDGIGIQNQNNPPYNIVIDHCSVSWAIDENIQFWYDYSDVTISYCITSEALWHSLHPKGEHSMGMIIGRTGAKQVSVHHNLMAHNMGRNPLITTESETEIINNVVYNWLRQGTDLANCYTEGHISNVIGNYYKTGPSTLKPENALAISSCSTWPNSIYVKGNIGPGRQSDSLDEWAIVNNNAGSGVKSSVPLAQARSSLVAQSAFDAYDSVLNNAGARPRDRDAVDTRIVNEVRQGTGRIIDSQNDVGGWPNLAENRRTLTVPSNPHGDDDGDGYTNLEEWLHGYAAEVE